MFLDMSSSKDAWLDSLSVEPPLKRDTILRRRPRFTEEFDSEVDMVFGKSGGPEFKKSIRSAVFPLMPPTVGARLRPATGGFFPTGATDSSSDEPPIMSSIESRPTPFIVDLVLRTALEIDADDLGYEFVGVGIGETPRSD